MRVATDLSYVGNPDDIRVKASLAARHGSSCPGYLWKEVRPALRPDTDDWWFPREPWPFMQGVIVDAVRRISRGADPEEVLSSAVEAEQRGVPLHPGVQEYVQHAIRAYLDVHESRMALLGTELHHHGERTIDTPRRGLQGWGLWLEDSSGSFREVRRLRNGTARGTDRADMVWAAVMAKLAVDGRTESAAGPDSDPELVVVAEVGLGDSSDVEVFRGSASEARDLWDRIGRPAVTEMISSDSLRPGFSCSSCFWLTTCPAVPVSRGALGLSKAPFRRSVSAADLDLYARCPAQYGMRRIFYVPADSVDDTDAQLRGLLTHRWLAHAHSRPGPNPCAEDDLPLDGIDSLGVLSGHEASVVAPFLVDHPRDCALAKSRIRSLEVEPRRQLFDPDADVLMVASPDLAIVDDGIEIWRETKTTVNEFPPSIEDLLQTFTSASFDMVLLAELSSTQVGEPVGTVEFEILRPFESAVYFLDVADSRLLDLARRRITELALHWSQDVELAATPGPLCGWCSVRQWCPSADATAHGQKPAETAGPDETSDVDAEVPF